MKVAVFGLGYVGTVTASCLADSGHVVIGVDPERTKVDLINSGTSPVVEPGIAELVREVVGRGVLRAVTDPDAAVAEAEVTIICVGTPSLPEGGTDLQYVLRAAADIASALARGGEPRTHTVVVRSTVPPGTVEDAVVPVLAEGLAGRKIAIGVAMCPEFLREGSGLADFFDPPFTVVGTPDEATADVVRELFAFVGRPVRHVSVRTAEGLKYACNAFHATKVSFTNELSRLYRRLGVDARSVMEIFCEDDRLNISDAYLRPGFAFGGSCLPKDLRSLLYLGRINSVETPLLTATLVSNQQTVADVLRRVEASGGHRVALLGLSFKSSTDDLRESPNVQVAESLIGRGYDVAIYDPVIMPSRLVGANRAYVRDRLPHLGRLLTESPEDVLHDADIAVVSSPAGAVVDALVGEPPPTIIDLTGRLGDGVEALPGYQGVGW